MTDASTMSFFISAFFLSDAQLRSDIIFITVPSAFIVVFNQCCGALLNSSKHVLIRVILYEDPDDRCVFHIGSYETLTCFYLNCLRTIGNISTRIKKPQQHT